MTESHGRIIRKRNPGMLQPDEEVTAQFVVREHELSTVLEILRGNVEADSCQHTLIVAPRGRGKTMLLARIAAELRADAELASCLLPVRFMEESDEVFSAADFWLEALFYLALAIDKPSPEFARSLRDTREDLASRWRERELDERARAAVLEAADTLGMRLVLMVENLQALCANADPDFGWKLRKTLQTEPQIILVATATSRFEGLDDAREPFFELFRIISLAPLDTAQCRRLWEIMSGDTASEREIRPLEILTGGSPRFLVIVAGFARHRSMRRLMEELVRLIDDLTDTFRGDLQALPKTERRVLLAIADLWQPSSTGEIAARARMDVRTVSTMLGRLVERGAVIWDGAGRKRLYAIVERLYSIYYKLRRERDEAAIVQNLLHFMTVFYSDHEIVAMSGQLISEAARSVVIRAGVERARFEIPQLSRVFTDSTWADIKQLTAYDKVVERFGSRREPRSLVRVASALVRKGHIQGQLGEHATAIATYDEAIDRFNKAIAQERGGEYLAAIATNDDVANRFGSSDDSKLQHAVARALFNKSFQQRKCHQHAAAMATCDEIVARFRTSGLTGIQEMVAGALVNKGELQRVRGEYAAEAKTYDEVIARFGASAVPNLRMLVAQATFNKGFSQGQRREHTAATASYGQLLERFSVCEVPYVRELVAQALFNKAHIHGERGEHEAEAAIYDLVVERFGDSDALELQKVCARALINKGVALTQRVKHMAAITSFNEVVERFRNSDCPDLRALVAQAMFLRSLTHSKIGKQACALRTCDELESRFGSLLDNRGQTFKWNARWLRTIILISGGSRKCIMDVFCSLYAAFGPSNDEMTSRMIDCVSILVSGGGLDSQIVDTLSSDPQKSVALAPLIVALRQRAGEEVRAPMEVLEVAADIRRQIDGRPPNGRVHY